MWGQRDGSTRLADGQILKWTSGGGRGLDPAKLAGVVIDNAAAKLTGEWTPSGTTPGFVGADHLHDGNDAKGTKSATFTPVLPKAATYEFRLWATPLVNRATNVPVTLRLADGDRKVTVNQRAGPCKEGFVVLSTFSCPAGQGRERDARQGRHRRPRDRRRRAVHRAAVAPRTVPAGDCPPSAPHPLKNRLTADISTLQ